LDWIGKASGDDVSLLLTMLYNLWQAGNDGRESRKIANPRSVATHTFVGIEEWKNIQKPGLSVSVKPNENWLKSNWDWAKINTDGAYQASEATGGEWSSHTTMEASLAEQTIFLSLDRC
jgi:hypothetical protein